MNSSLIIIWFHVNAQPHVARMTLRTLTDLRYQTSLHPPYSLDLSSTNYHFFMYQDTFFTAKIFHSKGEVETVFSDFLASKPFEFSRTGINNLVNRWQKCINVPD